MRPQVLKAQDIVSQSTGYGGTLLGLGNTDSYTTQEHYLTHTTPLIAQHL